MQRKQQVKKGQEMYTLIYITDLWAIERLKKTEMILLITNFLKTVTVIQKANKKFVGFLKKFFKA